MRIARSRCAVCRLEGGVGGVELKVAATCTSYRRCSQGEWKMRPLQIKYSIFMRSAHDEVVGTASGVVFKRCGV